MIHPELADKIIDFLKGDTLATPTSVATELNEDPEKVKLTIRQMANLKPFWFEIQEKPGDEDFNIIRRSKFENEVILWKKFGGFSKHQADIEKEVSRDQEIKEHHIKTLNASTASIEEAIKASIEARERANWALFVAALAIIFSIFAWILS